MLLPPGILKALKGKTDAIVIVTLSVAATVIGGAGDPWAGVASLAVGGFLYHIRCSSAERHQRETAELELSRTVQNVELVRARHREMLSIEQPSLAFPAPRAKGSRKADKGG